MNARKGAARRAPGGVESGANPHGEHSRARRGRQAVPTAHDRPHIRRGAAYLGRVCVGTIRGGAFLRGFDAGTNGLAWGRAVSYRADLLRLLQRQGVVLLVARDRATGDRYRISLATFLAVAEPLDLPGYGPQLAADLRHWHETRAPAGPRQLRLEGVPL